MSSDEQWYLGADTGRVCLNIKETPQMVPGEGIDFGIHYPPGEGYAVKVEM